ncbi:MAG TPA: hypothetical protein VGQ83_07160 [Polyangia bacterium]
MLLIGLTAAAAVAQEAAPGGAVPDATYPPICPPCPKPPKPDPNAGRSLGGHLFIPSEFVLQPFAVTALGVFMGFGRATVTVPLLGRDRDAKLIEVAPSTTLEIAITKWLAINFGFDADVISGVNSTGAVNYGAAFGYDYGGGVLLSLPLGRARLAARFDYLRQQLYNLNILTAIRGSLSQGDVDASGLVSDQQSNRYVPAISGAVGLHPAIGLFGSLAYRHDSAPLPLRVAIDAFEVGAGVSIDLKPVTRVPIGFLGAYQFVWEDATDSAHRQVFSGGIFYTGRRHLSAGLEGERQVGASVGGNELKITRVVVGMKYFW